VYATMMIALSCRRVSLMTSRSYHEAAGLTH